MELTETQKTQLRDAVTKFVRSPATITDPEVRQRCEEMRDTFLTMLNGGPPSYVFIGAYDTPETNPNNHFGAFDDRNNHIHFDPKTMRDIATSSNVQWQAANTALHEAAHYLRQKHSEAPVAMNYRGFKIPIYESKEIYFSDLNPGGASCMKN